MPQHQHQSLRLVKVSGEKPEGTEWFECKQGCLVLMKVICQLPQRAEEQEAARAGIRIQKAFIALDESLHDTIEDARSRNRLIREVEELDLFLEPRSRALEAGDGYMQQDLIKIDEMRAQMLKLAAKEFRKSITERTRLETLLEEVYDADDVDHPLFKLYARLKCIDRDGREWQNKSLADDPQAGKQVCLNARPNIVSPE